MPPALAEVSGLASERHEVARAWAEQWSQSWFLDASGTDHLRFGEIEAGWATHAEAYFVLHDFARRRLGLLPPSTSLVDRLKTRGHDRLIRAAAARLTISLNRVRSADVACVLEIPTPSMTDGVLAVARELRHRATIMTSDPRATRRARQAGLPATTLRLSPIAQLRLLRDASDALGRAFASLRRSPPRMMLGDHEVSADTFAALAPFVRNSLPWLAPEREAIARAIGRAAPRSIVLASDQHRIGRLASAVARAEGVRTIVVQHGLPQMRIGLVPVVADVVATWSEASREWFIAHGTAPERLRITGNPRWSFRPTDREGPISVLVALSPAPVEVNRTVVALAVGAVHALGGDTELTVKLHPGHRDWSWVPEAMTAARLRRIAIREPIEPLLERATATVVLRSTVAMDSLAAGCPVVFVRVAGGLSGADAELGDASLPVVETSEALADAIRTVAGERGRILYFARRAANVERHLGPRDGAARVASIALGEIDA